MNTCPTLTRNVVSDDRLFPAPALFRRPMPISCIDVFSSGALKKWNQEVISCQKSENNNLSSVVWSHQSSLWVLVEHLVIVHIQCDFAISIKGKFLPAASRTMQLVLASWHPPTIIFSYLPTPKLLYNSPHDNLCIYSNIYIYNILVLTLLFPTCFL